MDGMSWALLMKPIGAIVILGGWVLLARSIDRIEDVFPEGRIKRLLFKRFGDGDLTDPVDDPGRYQRMRRARKARDISGPPAP